MTGRVLLNCNILFVGPGSVITKFNEIYGNSRCLSRHNDVWVDEGTLVEVWRPVPRTLQILPLLEDPEIWVSGVILVPEVQLTHTSPPTGPSPPYLQYTS